MSADRRNSSNAGRRAYWRANLRLIAVLLAIWALVSLGCGVLLVEPLNQFRIGKLPLGFWFAQQGSIYVFVLLIFVYAWLMDRLDRKHGVAE
jgi:putative solute:sodium symporter small subunit